MSNTAHDINPTDPTPSQANPPTIWPTFLYEDAPAAIEFLERGFGFVATMVVSNPDDVAVIEHAQLRWPEGGGVMLSSSGRADNPCAARPVGVGSAYVVTSDPDRVHERALAGGAESFLPLTDESYGNRGFSVTDPEGNLWSFGTYGGES